MAWGTIGSCDVEDSSKAYRPGNHHNNQNSQNNQNHDNNQNPSVCGNGIVEGSEQCDTNARPCSELGNYSGGEAVCTSFCQWDVSACELKRFGKRTLV